MLYLLIFTDTDLSYDEYSEYFHIGTFKTEAEATKTAQHYIQNIQGFCDFPCTYRIVKKMILENLNCEKLDKVWLVQAWNTNDNFDEIDIIESLFILTSERAHEELLIMKEKYKREEWTVDEHIIGKLNWKEGFIRL